MTVLKKNIAIIAQPQVGKSTLLGRALEKYPGKTSGLITREIKQGNERVGFEMGSLGRSGQFSGNVIAHKNIVSDFKVSKYGVDKETVRKTALELWHEPIIEGNILYLDEVGQMQVHDDNFRDLVRKYLSSKNICIVTLSAIYEHPFIEQIKKREDTIVLELTTQNRNDMRPFVIGLLDKIKKAQHYASDQSRFVRENDLVELRSDHGKRIINLKGKTCTCRFFNTFKEYHLCSHILAAEVVYGV